jgi:L-cysteine desulfidase
MHELTQLLKNDMKPALGVTEPGAIAFSVAKAKSYTSGELVRVSVAMNSGMYKNAFTCGIPGSSRVGSIYAAALGYVAGDPDKGLESLAGVTPEDNEAAELLVQEGKVEASLSGITSRIFIEATVETEEDTAVVTIRDSHTNIVCITVNGEVVYGEADAEEEGSSAGTDIRTGAIIDAIDKSLAEDKLIHRYTLAELVDYADTVDISEITFIGDAYVTNLALLMEGLGSDKTTFGPMLRKKNGGKLVSDDEQKTASLMCNGAIEARVIGLDKPAMSITGSGAHGIIATMPLYAAYCVNHYSMEKLLRATALSYLVCTYIKEYSGKLSAFCGCAIAAGSGMACALVYLRGGTVEMMAHTLNNMASSITGMICDGGNQGCTMKGIAAVDAAYQSVDLAMNGVYIYNEHGINGKTPEDTMRNMGLIASPGMVGTEKTIVEIFESK